MDENDEKTSRQLERLKLEHTHSMELLRATVAFEHAALKPPILLNGGAVVVFLALFGALKAKNGDPSVIDENWVLWATVAWVLGLLSGTLATGKAYYSQLAFRKAQDYRLADDRERESGNDSEAADAKSNADKHHTKGMSHRRHAEVSAGASIAFFVFGVALAYMAISESFRLFVS